MEHAAHTQAPTPPQPADLHEAIRRRAEEIYVRSGRIPGRDVENWAQAEREILHSVLSLHPAALPLSSL